MPEALQELVSRVIDGRYRVEQMIAFGGMGAVFHAKQLPLGYDVALKVLHPHLSQDEQTVKRFDREAYSASKLDHPNCVKVFDYGNTLDGITYMAMELLQGAELKTMLGAPMPPEVAVGRMIQILEGLGHAHARGIIHRDLKPANVFVTADSSGREVLKIVDFGIARILEKANDHEKLTLTGIVYGTPHYMSPEQATGGTADERSDIYAAGLIFYRMLAGRPPFQAEGAAELMRMQIIQPPDLLPHEVPRILAHIVMRMLEKDPARRYGSTREIIERLEHMRPMLQGVPAAPMAPPPAAPLPGPSPAQSMMPPMLRSSADGDTARLGAGSWQDAAAASLAGREAMRSGVGQAPSAKAVVPWLLMAVALGIAVAAIGMLLWLRQQYEGELADLRGRPGGSESGAAAQSAEAEAAEEEVAVADPVPASEPAAPEDAAPGAGVEDPAASDMVKLTIRTNVDADILDAGDLGLFGHTNGDPVDVERSDGSVGLVLRAEGHADHPLTITPDRDLTLDVELTPVSPVPSKGRSKSARRGKKKAKASAESEPPVQKPAQEKESIDGAKLRDPW